MWLRARTDVDVGSPTKQQDRVVVIEQGVVPLNDECLVAIVADGEARSIAVVFWEGESALQRGCW